MSDMVGRTIGGYRIESLFETGDMGNVYRGTSLANGVTVAVKIIHSNASDEPAFRRRFFDALETADALDHPHILKNIAYGEEDGRYYVVTELCLHGSVRTLIERARGTGQPIPLDLGLDLIRQAATALDYFHAQGVIHGRLTPENLLLASSTDSVSEAHWSVRISDIGIAQLQPPLESVLPYLSPEQCLELVPDGCSDFYSLGVIFYEAVTNQRPFAIETIEDALQQHVDVEPPFPRSMRPDLPVPVEDVILSCLAKEPSDRIASGAELIARLTATNHDPAPARHDSDTNVNQVDPQPLRISVADEPVVLSPGVASSTTIELSNRGNRVRTALVSVEPTPIAHFPDLPRQLTVGPEQHEAFASRVTLETSRPILAGEYRVHFRVRDLYDDSVSDDTLATLYVPPQPSEHLTIRSLGKRGRNQSVYQIDLFNNGNTIAHYSLEADDQEQQLRYRFNQELVTLEPGESRTIVLSVVDRWRGSSTDDVEFEVAAVPAHGETVTVRAIFARPAGSGTEIRRAMVGFGALGVVAVVLLVLLFTTLLDGNALGSPGVADRPTVAPTSVPTAIPTPTPTIVPTKPAPTPSPTQAAPTPTPTPTPTPQPTPTPPPQAPMVVRQINTSTNSVALTFSISNDGSSATEVKSILQILSARDVHATFSIRGDWASAHPDLIKSIIAQGHQLINETYDHKSFTGVSDHQGPLTKAQRIDELTKAGAIVKQITGINMQPYYRPPYGDMDTGTPSTVEADAAQAGYTVAVLWSIDTRSWETNVTVGQMISAASAAKRGDVILFSVSATGGSKDISALPQIIDNLRAQNVGFGTVKQLVGK